MSAANHIRTPPMPQYSTKTRFSRPDQSPSNSIVKNLTEEIIGRCVGRSGAISLYQHRPTSRYLRNVDKRPQNAKTQSMFEQHHVLVTKSLLFLNCYWLFNRYILLSLKQVFRRIKLLPRTPITIMKIAFSFFDYRSPIVLTLKHF